MRYIINEQVIGCETVDIQDERLTSQSENQIVLVLNERTQDISCLQTYYSKVKQILKAGIPIYVVMVADSQKIRGSICNLMALYGNYNVYQVPDSSFISSAYLDNLPEREVTYDEVATFLQSDLAAYDDLDTVLSGVQDCISRDDIEGLKTLVESHLPTIESAPTVFSNMKVQIDSQNQGRWQEKIQSLREQLNDMSNKNEQKDLDIKDKEQQIDDLKSQLKDANRQLTQNKADIEELKLQANKQGPQIRSYPTVKTQLLKCKTEHIIYIKEIQQIPYINSFVVMLQEMVKSFRYNCKLIVYDNSSATQITYGNMQKVDSAEFESNKQMLMQKTPKFVVTEPAPQILKDILQSMSPQFDVVIIYDRMRQAADLVEGNNVYKFWVVNSYNDYIQTKNLFKIDRTDTVITRPQSRIGADVIDIPRIKAYEQEAQDNGRLAKYKGVQTTICKKPLMLYFMGLCNIQRRTN